MNFQKFQALVEHRTGFRTMENPTASGEYFSDSCGDLYTFFLKVGPGDVIEDVSYFTTGCGFGTATCSLLVELAKGKTVDEALAITDADIRSKYQFGSRIRSDWTPGSHFEMRTPDGATVLGEGENLEVDRPRRLVQSFRALWSEDVKREGTSRVTWEIEQIGDSCRLTVTHDQLREGAHGELYGGWPMILSGLKTLLETGELLTTPGSLQYG